LEQLNSYENGEGQWEILSGEDEEMEGWEWWRRGVVEGMCGMRVGESKLWNGREGSGGSGDSFFFGGGRAAHQRREREKKAASELHNDTTQKRVGNRRQ